MSDQGYLETWARGLQIPYFGDFTAGLAAVGDQLLGWARRVVYEHMPATASSVSLPLLASERQIIRGGSETDEALAARLSLWIQQHQLDGSPAGLLAAIYLGGFGGVGDCVLLQQYGGHFTLNGDGPDLTLVRASSAQLPWLSAGFYDNSNPAIPASTDGKPAIPPFTIPLASLGPTPMDGEGNQYNGRFVLVFLNDAGAQLATQANLDRLRAIVRLCRPASRPCVGIYAYTEASVWDYPSGRTWDDDGDPWWDEGTFTAYAGA